MKAMRTELNDSQQTTISLREHLWRNGATPYKNQPKLREEICQKFAITENHQILEKEMCFIWA